MFLRRKVLVAILIISGATLWANDHLTVGVDNGRTGWIKDEKIFNTTNVQTMKLLWKIKLDSKPREMHNLFQPLIAERVTTAHGTREMAVVAGVSDDLFGIDVANGEVVWTKKFDSTYTPPTGGRGGGTLCPGGQTAVPLLAPRATRGAYTIYAISWDGRLRQVNLADGKDVAAPEKFVQSNGKPYALNLLNGVIYTVTAQGCGGVPNSFWSFDLTTRKASSFQPAGGGLWGRRGVSVSPEGVVYMGTGDAAYNPATRSLGNAIVGVRLAANKQLELVDYFAPKNANFLFRRDLDMNVTPVVVDYRKRKFLIATSKECRVWLLDREALGGEDHRTTLDTTPLICNERVAFDGHGVWGSLAAWQDSRGTQWVLVPFWGPVASTFHAPVEHSRPKGGGVAAFKLEGNDTKWQLVPAWLSRDMDLAEEILVANGVAFTYAAGEDATQIDPDRAWDEPGGGHLGGGLNPTSPRRIPNSRRAAVYALDALTGKELWSSGDQITSWNHFSGLTVANGRVYVAMFDGTIYCFGVPRPGVSK